MSVGTPVVLDWNGPERRIYLKQGVTDFHWIDDIYKEYRNERRLNEDFRKYNAFMIASGNEAKGGGKATPRLLKLLEDVKVIAWDENIELYVGGEAITDNADIDPTLYDNSTRTQPLIINYQPPAAEVIVVDAIAESLDYGGVLHYDENSIHSGQVHPIGTSAQPVNNITDGLIIASTYGLNEMHTLSNITLTQNINNISITGITPALIFNSNGFSTNYCRFNDIIIVGDFNNSLIVATNCGLQNVLNIYGSLNNCFYFGKILISANQNLNTDNCQSGIPGLDSPEVDMNPGVDTTFSSRLYSGGLTITNCDTAGCTATLSFVDGGKPHLEPSCTDGLLSVRGIAYLDDRSNGTTVETSALLDPSKIEFIIDVLEGDMVPTQEEWKILQKTTKAILVHKNTNVVGNLTQLIEP